MKGKALVIEDNDQNLYLVRFILEHNDYEVCAATDGESGIELAAQCKPDIIFLDIQLPVMDGYTVAGILRTNAELAGIPIIAITSYAMPGDREKAIAAGCSDYMEKPIDPDTFIKKIKHHVPERN